VKTIPTTKLIEICQANGEQVENAAQLIGRKFDTQTDWIKTGIEAGFYQAWNVHVAGSARYLVVYHITDQRTLFVNSAAQLTAEPGDFGDLVSGMIALAKHHACSAVEGVTLRAGVLKKLLQSGFEPVGVTVSLAI
jgi:hypothetical protein